MSAAEEALQRIARAAADALRRAPADDPKAVLNVPMFVDDLNTVAQGLGVIERTAHQWAIFPTNAVRPPVYPHPEAQPDEGETVALLLTPIPVQDLVNLADALQSTYGGDLRMMPFGDGEMARIVRAK